MFSYFIYDGFKVNGNHETMNVEGDFRYVDSGAYDECSDFLEHLDNYGDNWEDGFGNWIDVAGMWKEDRKMTQSSWGPWNLVKVLLPFSFFFFHYRKLTFGLVSKWPGMLETRWPVSAKAAELEDGITLTIIIVN